MPGADLSGYSDAELQAMLAQAQPAGGAAADLSQVPTEQLQAMLPPESSPAQAGLVGAPQSTPPAPTIAPRNGAESAVRGALQGASLGWGDELASYPAALIGGDPLLGLELPQETFGERRAAALEFFRAKNRGAQETNPALYLGGQVAGGLAVPGATGVIRSAALTGGARMAALAASGGTTGAIAGAGNAEGGVGERLGAGVRGGLIGAVVAPGMDAAVRAAAVPVAAAARGLRTGAGYALSRVAGGIQRDVAPAGGPAAFARAGLEGEARGLIRPWDVFPGAADRQAGRVADFARQSTDDIVAAIDDSGARVAVQPLQQVLHAASAELRQFPSANSAPLERVDGLIKDLGKLADPAGTVSARTLQSAKKTIDNLISTWDPTKRSSLAQDLNRALYRSVMEAQEQAVETSAGAGGRATYETAKRASSLAQKLERFQESFQARQANQLSNIGGLHGAVGGIAAIGSGDLLTGLATYGATRALTSPRTAAIGLSAAARAARVLPAYAASPLNPLLARSGSNALISSLDRR
jgi:hypothetical protein